MGVQEVFATPTAEVKDIAGGSGLMTESIVSSLRRTRPWVLMVAILGFLSSLLVALIAIPMLLGGSLLGEEFSMTSGVLGVGVMMGMGVFYLLIAAISFWASLHLLRFAGAIRQAVDTLTQEALEEALLHQANFWRLVGVLTLVSIAIMVLSIVGMIVLATMYKY